MNKNKKFKYLLEGKNFYKIGEIVLIEYWYNNMICPVKILEQRGRSYLITHNIPQSLIKNAPDEIIKSSDIIDNYRKNEIPKQYNLFENSYWESPNDLIIQDLQDIFIEVNDEPLWNVRFWLGSISINGNNHKSFVIIIEVIDDDPEYEIEGQNPPPIISECIERTIDFMSGKGFNNYKITFEEEESDIIKTIHIDNISELDIWSNNFIRIEFW